MAAKLKKVTAKEDIREEIAAPGEIKFQLVSTDLVDDPEQPMRTDMTPASVEDLVMSIKQVGIIEPIVVKPVNARFEVIAGHRRLYAAKLAKIPEVPCYIRNANKEQTEMLKIHENLYRSEIKPADEAKHYSYLIDKQKMSPTQIAQLISKSPSYVTDRLAILGYPEFLKQALDNAQITFSVAREFARFDDLKQMQQAVYYAQRSGMTQEMARKWVTDYKRSQNSSQIQEEVTINGENGTQEIVHSATCIYCGEGVSLIEAEVVYMHLKCRNEVTRPQPLPQSSDSS